MFLLLACCREYPTYPHGGYDYPKDLPDKDTNLYHQQLQGLIPERIAFYDTYLYLFYQPYNEPNLSIRPQPKETFRITYRTAFHDAVIISFNEDSLTVKKNNGTYRYKTDTTGLTAIEKVHLALLDRWYPIDTLTYKPWRKRYFDSLVKLYPQLPDRAYYHKLIEKTIAYSDEKFSFETTKYPITKEQYKSLVEGINTSGFWSLPYHIDCAASIADGVEFTFEANTKKKYKVVWVFSCPNDTSNFHKACQKIVEAAKMDEEVQLVWWEKNSTSTEKVEPVKVKSVTIEPIK
jgi:hypothetical protein